MNRLIKEKSAYLKRASHQKVDWYPWTEDAFERANKEDKPVFLSTGAAWCHWCHVMAKESFEDDETARLMNELFINIKLDRDERPDIDRRYQQAVAAMGGGSGWPLSVFLTPDKQAFYGGTYFPPESIQGRPSFKSVLTAVSDFYKARHDEAVRYAERVAQALKPEPMEAENLHEAALTSAEAAILSQVDQENGGFGTSPKFPAFGAVAFLLRCWETGTDAAGDAARKTLLAMASGGFHDHLGGGFHRYSVDESWVIPHFEKMADDNAGLLRNYVDGYAAFGDGRFRDAAAGIITFTREVLSDPDGGFYASQDADVTPGDEGGYFTWTDNEFRELLDPEEYAVLSNYLLHEKGGMHHDPRKKVLFTIIQDPVELAAALGRDRGEVMRIIDNGRKKLLAARVKRETPFIDRTLYTSLNGMMIAAYFHAYSVFGDEAVRTFAVRSLVRILRERKSSDLLLHSDGVPAGLDDYIHLIDALTAAYEAAAGEWYLETADRLMGDCIAKFYDAAEGGFFDTEQAVLGLRLKRVEDAPHPSANAVAIMVLLKLSFMTGKEEYRKAAGKTLGIFLPIAREIGVHGGAFFCSLDAWFRMLKLTIEARPDSELAGTARFLGSRVPLSLVYGEDRGRVIACSRDTCFEPVHDRRALAALVKKTMARADQS